VDSVEVGDHCVDIDLLRRLHYVSHGAGQDQIMKVIDIDSGQFRHLHDRRTAEETMPRCFEADCRHDIEGTCLAEVGLSVLAPESQSRIMVLSSYQPEATAWAP
jgi:hypothetical protein